MKIAALLTSLIPLSQILAITSDWVNPATPLNWGDAANWNNGVPNSTADIAVIGSNTLTLTQVVTINQNVPNLVVAEIDFYTTQFYGFNIVGTLPITLHAGLTPNAAIYLTTNGPQPDNVGIYQISAPMIVPLNLNLFNFNAFPLGVPTLILSGGISGPGSVTYGASHLMTLSGTNTFSGGLIIAGTAPGALQLGAVNTLPSAGAVTMISGTLDLNGYSQVIGTLSGNGGSITLGTATLTTNTTTNTTFGGTITGGAGSGLTVEGTGSLTLTNAGNNYSLTTVKAGELIMGTAGAIVNDVVMMGGILNLNNFNQSIKNLSGTGGSITLGNAQLTIALTQQETFAGVISGAGSVVFGGNTWILNAPQNYTGGTSITSGTIQLGVSNGLFPSKPLSIANPGIFDLQNFSQTLDSLSGNGTIDITLAAGQLTMAPSLPPTFTGTITGAGGLIFQGPATWTVQNPLSYTGGTTINNGILQMGAMNALAPSGVVTVNNPGTLFLNTYNLIVASLSGDGNVNLGSGALTLNTTTTTTFLGPITGSGSLTVSGSGTQILSGSNTYFGGTTINPGASLQGNTLSLQGNIANNGTVFFNQGSNGSYAGVLSGNGQLQIGGGGTVTFTGISSLYSGTVNVQNGELDAAAGARLSAATITVSSGATLGGSGTFVANVESYGTINPGSESPDGKLTIKGNVNFQPGSTYAIDISPTSFDQLIANSGVVTIQPGATVSFILARGDYEEDTLYPIILSNNPVVGQFNDIVQTNPFIETDLIYNQIAPGSVQLHLEIKSLSDVIQGGNAGAIAKCISVANMKFDHDLEQLITDIIFFSVDQVREILDEMQPSKLRALSVAEETNTFFAQQTLNWRMAEFDRSTCEKEIAKCFPWNFWVSLAGNWTDQRHAEHNVGYTAPAVGFTTGFDGKISDHLFLGLAVEYGHTSLHWQENGGSTTINRMSAGPYPSYIGRFGYVNSSILGSFAYFETQRNIPTFSRTAESSHYGETLMPHLDGGLVFHPAPSIALTPFAMVDVLFRWEDAFQETGAQSLNFSIASSNSTMLRSEVGLKISKCAVHSHTKWVHDLKASWVREDRFSGKDLTATFRQFPCTFTVEGLYPSRNFLDVGMGLTFIFKQDRLAASLRYEGLFGEGVTSQSGIAQLLTRF